MRLDELGDRLFAYVPEVAEILGRDERTVRAAIRAGDIPATKTGQRYIVPVSWLREQAGGPVPPTAAAGPDLDELADRVADRVLARLARMFSALAPDATAPGPALPGPGANAADLYPLPNGRKSHAQRTAEV